MRALQFSGQIRAKINRIRSDKDYPSHIKIMLIQSLIKSIEIREQVRFHEEKYRIRAQKKSNIRLKINKKSEEAKENLIERILQRQRKKLELDEEIETVQDDLLQIQRVVQTKRVFNERLDTMIFEKMQEMEKQQKKSKSPKTNHKKKSIFQLFFN